jgi:hypothetical protein
MTPRSLGLRAARLLPLLGAIAALLIAAPTHAQEQHTVRGEVVDSVGRPVQNAMVVALNRADSVLVQFAIAEGDGRFLIRDLGAGEYILQVTSLGYGTVRRDFEVGAADVDAGRVVMAIVAAELDPLIVNVEQVPFVNRRDTLDYNAAAFQLRANASVEDLLASLPGVQVEDDGTIVAQGEQVTQILVDGKEFFGGNATIATRNLPADAVERVQIYDQKSDMAEFTGIEDGEEQRTLNLQLRESARSGNFGTATGAVGGEQGGAAPVGPETTAQLRYQQSASINRFSPNLQLALLGGMNNINQSPVAFGGGRSGRNGGGGNGGNGLTEAMALGANVGYDPGNDRWIRGSYFFNGSDNVEDQSLQREQFLGEDLSQSLDQLTSSRTDTRSHRLNLNAQYQFSEGHDLRFRGNFSAGSTDRTRIQNQTTLFPDGGLVNSAVTNLDSESDNLGGNAQLTWRKRLGDSGRSLVFEARGNVNDRDSSSDLETEIGTPSVGDIVTYDELVQLQTQDNLTTSESQRIALTQPLDDARRKVLEVYAERRSVSEEQVQSVFDVSGGTQVFDPALSSNLDQGYDYLNGGFRLSRNTESTFLTIGAEYQRSSLDGRVLDRDQRIERDFDFFLPSAVFRWEIEEGWTLEGNYRASAREPDARELQPFVDNTDPLNIYVGNPGLDPEFRHSISLNQRYFDQFTFRNIGAFARFTYTTDAIQLARSTDSRGVQTVTPLNTDDGWSLNTGIDFSTPLRSIGAEIELGYDLAWSRQQQLLNLEDNLTNIVRNGLSLSLENRRKTSFDLEGGVDFNFNDVTYSLNERLNQSYVNTTLNGRAEWYPSDAWTIGSSIQHRIFDEEVFGPGQNVTLWQASLSRFFMDQKGELQLVAFDLLDQNQGVAFVNSANFVQESRTASLGRHFMLRVVYRIGRTMGGGSSRGGLRERP